MPITTITTQVSVGEFFDKISILEIKKARITDPEKLRNVILELETLIAIRDETVVITPQLAQLCATLKQTNEILWDIEEAIRNKERRAEFDNEFIELARSVYITNDKRMSIKREINKLLGSQLIEEKSHAPYQREAVA
jgi:hypothetical protein